MNAFTSQHILFNGIRNFGLKRLSSTVGGASYGIVPKVTTRVVGLTMAASIGITAPWIYNSRNLIYNDAVVDASRNLGAAIAALGQGAAQESQPKRSRFGGKLDYRQLCIGSIFGLVLGVVIGKISTLLVYVSAVGFLTLQWLQNRGIVDKNATNSLFARYIIKSGRETIDFNTLIWERPSFKISFLLTFLLAAANI